MKLLPLCLVLMLAVSNSAQAADALLSPNKPIQLTGTKGKFDFIKIDSTRRRLLACHTGNASLDVIDLDSGKLLASVPTGNAQGVAIDDKGGRYFVSCSKPPQLAIVDATTFTVTGEVPVPSAADVCAYSPVFDRVVVDSDEKPQQWWIDPQGKSIESTVTYPGSGMEDLAFDHTGMLLIQNLKDISQVAALDYKSYKFAAKLDDSVASGFTAWPTDPAEKPHGLALAEGDNVLIAGGNGKLVLRNYKTGQFISACDIAQRVDEIAYDPGLGRVYCASGTSVISVAFVGVNTLSTRGSVTSAQGTHSIAVDPKTHAVWIAFVQGTTPCVQSFSAK